MALKRPEAARSETGTSRAAGSRAAFRGLLAAALLLLAVNLRLSIASVPPVLDEIRTTLGLSAVGAGLLTMLPVLCMGAFAPVAGRLARRVGEDMSLLAAALLLGGGLLVRLAPGIAGLFGGTLLTGVAIALLNVLLPAVIKRDFVRPGAMMALYTTLLSSGAALAAGLTVPATHLFSGTAWRPALAIWALPALLAAAVWGVTLAKRSRTVAAQPGPALAHSPWRSTLAWRITAYMGSQSLLFYAFISWAPDILQDDAGSSKAAAGGLLGLLFAAASVPAVWMVLIGVGQGATISLALTLIVLRAPDQTFAAGLSGMAQTVGYLLAAVGPLVVGVLHSTTGSWTGPLGLLVGVAVVSVVGGLLVDRVDARAGAGQRTGPPPV